MGVLSVITSVPLLLRGPPQGASAHSLTQAGFKLTPSGDTVVIILLVPFTRKRWRVVTRVLCSLRCLSLTLPSPVSPSHGAPVGRS